MEAKGLLYVVERIKTKIILSLGYRGSVGPRLSTFRLPAPTPCQPASAPAYTANMTLLPLNSGRFVLRDVPSNMNYLAQCMQKLMVNSDYISA